MLIYDGLTSGDFSWGVRKGGAVGFGGMVSLAGLVFLYVAITRQYDS